MFATLYSQISLLCQVIRPELHNCHDLTFCTR